MSIEQTHAVTSARYILRGIRDDQKHMTTARAVHTYLDKPELGWAPDQQAIISDYGEWVRSQPTAAMVGERANALLDALERR